MVTKAQAKANGKDKAPAVKLDISQLVVIGAYAKNFSTGSRGFQGKLLDPATGKRYQVQAVEIGSKAS